MVMIIIAPHKVHWTNDAYTAFLSVLAAFRIAFLVRQAAGLRRIRRLTRSGVPRGNPALSSGTHDARLGISPENLGAYW